MLEANGDHVCEFVNVSHCFENVCQTQALMQTEEVKYETILPNMLFIQIVPLYLLENSKETCFHML